jgi:hypothetical protein
VRIHDTDHTVTRCLSRIGALLICHGIMGSGFDGRNGMGTNAGSKRRFWSLAGAVGFSYVITIGLIAARTAGL